MQLNLTFEPKSDLPVYKQMADAIAQAISEGSLPHGLILPSTRELAACNLVSRLTAQRCYDELAGQGYIKRYSRGKTRVNKPSSPSRLDTGSIKYDAVELSSYGQRLADSYNQAPKDFAATFGTTPLDLLPVTRFQECLYEAVREIHTLDNASQRDPFGLPALRKQLQALLFRTRGIKCSTEQIVLFPTTEGGVELLCRLTLSEGDVAAVEDPCLDSIRTSLELNGATVNPIPLDSEGISIEALADIDTTPRLIYVTPSRQDTTGRMMTRFRRNRLLQWVASKQSLIIEDDYDSEFRYGQEPEPALFSIDSCGRVVYRYNFWKSLYPLVKMSFLVIPTSLIAAFRGALNSRHADVPLIEQYALATFIRKGHYERHLHKCRKTFAIRRASMIHALTKLPGRPIIYEKQTGGTHLIVRLAQHLSAEQIEAAAKQNGLELHATRANYSNVSAPNNEYLLSFSNVDEKETEEKISQFIRLIEPQFSVPDTEKCKDLTNTEQTQFQGTRSETTLVPIRQLPLIAPSIDLLQVNASALATFADIESSPGQR